MRLIEIAVKDGHRYLLNIDNVDGIELYDDSINICTIGSDEVTELAFLSNAKAEEAYLKLGSWLKENTILL